MKLKKLFGSFLGDSQLLSNKDNWLSKQSQWIKLLQNYIRSEIPRHRHLPGTLNLDIYVCASEIFGRLGRLHMRFDDNNASIVDNAIINLFMAAYCSSRIGHLKRLAHWFSNASRSYCRLGEKDKAEQLVELAKHIIKKAMDSFSAEYSEEYRQSIMAETNLAYAEKYLLIDKIFPKSIEYFLQALKGSIYLRFARLISESLYGIARALDELLSSAHNKTQEEVVKNITYEEVKNIFTLELQDLQLLQKKSDNQNKIVQDVIEFLITIAKEINDSELTEELINLLSTKFMEQATNIWDDWHQLLGGSANNQHPISEMMQKGKFLNQLVPV